MTNIISQSERDIINYLSEKIDSGTAVLEDYTRYEQLLIKAGLTQEQIRAKLTANGFKTFNQYLDTRKSPKNKKEREVVEVIIVAGLVVLSAIIGLLIMTGKLVISDRKS